MTKDTGLAPARATAKPLFPDNTIKDFLVAAALHRSDKVRDYVERIGLHPDTTYGGKPTALCYCVLKPHHGLMSYLVEQGADINHCDRMGMRPLHYAALGGCDYCLAFLVSLGAPLDPTNRSEQTPLALATHNPRLASAAEFLRRCGASLDPSAPGARRFH